MKLLLSVILFFAFTSLSHAEQDSVEQVLADYVTKYVQQYYPENEFRYRVELRRLPNLLSDISPNQINGVRSNGRAPNGYAHFEAIVENNTRTPQVNFQAYVEVEQWLPVPAERITSGSTISSEQFRMAWVDITRQSGQFATKAEDVHGKIAGRMLREGSPVRMSELNVIPLIRAGESVTLIYIRGGLNIELQAVARQDGAAGEQIRVHSDRTRKTYIATVDPNGFVIWENTL